MYQRVSQDSSSSAAAITTSTNNSTTKSQPLNANYHHTQPEPVTYSHTTPKAISPDMHTSLLSHQYTQDLDSYPQQNSHHNHMHNNNKHTHNHNHNHNHNEEHESVDDILPHRVGESDVLIPHITDSANLNHHHHSYTTVMDETPRAYATDKQQLQQPQSQSQEEELPAQRRVIIVSIAMFMGYAILVSFQHKLKQQYKISDCDNDKSHMFSVAVSFLYIGNLIFRMAHNFVFSCVKPRDRVFIAMGSMMASMTILGVIVFACNETSTLAWVYLSYGLGGMGIGSFESNLLSSITPLGHATKMWAVIGFPVGFACVLILGFCLTALGTPTVAIYIIVLGSIVIGMLVFHFTIPVTNIANNGDSFDAFVGNVKSWRLWAPPIVWNCVSLMIDMFAVSLFSGVMLYILNGQKVPMFGPSSDDQLPHDWFFVIYNLFTLAGDSISRRVAYRMKPVHPLWFLILSIVGAILCLSKIAILSPFGIFLVFFANGSIYANSTRHIDNFVPKQFNLIALSFWLFIGDFGSVAGSNVIPYIRDWICHTHYPELCQADKGC